ncbi:MAG: ammonium transporter [Candidatus Anammoxibacter sp.]
MVMPLGKKGMAVVLLLMFVFVAGSQMVYGSESVKHETSASAGVEEHHADWNTSIADIVAVQKHNRAMHVMAMLMIGFGFLMVYVKRYGYSAVTATYVLVSIAIPLYIYLQGKGYFGEPFEDHIDKLLFAEFAAASLLIAVGAPLGRLKMRQYIVMALLFVPCYMLNEWILVDNGLGLIPKGEVVDTGGSLLIHAFGAYFGMGVIVRMTTKEDFGKEIESDKQSNQFSMLGSMVLWVFWPSFCAAIVEPALVPTAALNTVIALCGATLATLVFSKIIRGKIGIEDMANAALAGGVAIGATCAHVPSLRYALFIGLVAGTISVLGYTVIQPRIQKMLKGIDTCGVHNLHGMPGLFGGFMALFVVDGINTGSQIKGMVITIVLAVVAGLAVGSILSLLGHRSDSYDDAEEFIIEEA